jgi:predicted DNA-binding protein (UPF0251 family)
MPKGVYTRRPALLRFWSKVDKNGPIPERYPELGPCWDWTAALFDDGYGAFRLDDHQRRAHIVSYEWSIEPTNGLSVCHRCDRPRCVNPGHLFLDTPGGNSRDAAAKGRTALGRRNGMYTRPESRRPGAQNGRHTHPETNKLTAADVLEIRRLVANGVPQKDIAIRYGISRATVCNIVKRVTWKHLTQS